MVVALGLATGLRAVTVRAKAPYTTYVDEHFSLEASARQIATSSWDPDFYSYPSLVVNATTITAVALTGIRGDHAQLTAGSRVTVASPYVEVVEPWNLVLAGRLVIMVLSIATVLLVGLLGITIAGRTVGILAALLVAVLPMFVTRGSIVVVDTAAMFFATGALYCAARVSSARRVRDLNTWVVLGGVAGGLAFTSKYTIGSVLFGVLAVVALRRDHPVGRRLAWAAAACGGFALSAVLSMPALLLRPSAVFSAMRGLADIYDGATGPSYLYQLASRAEIGVPVLLAGVIGLGVLLWSRRARPVAVAYVAFAVPTVAVLFQSSFQPARNLLPLIPFLAIAAAALIVDVVEYVGTSLRLPRAASIAGATVVVLAFCWPTFEHRTSPYISEQRSEVDTRVTARKWIQNHVQQGDRVLVAQELAFLPDELRRVCADIDVRSQRRRVALDDYDWVVLGDLDPVRWSSRWSDELAQRRPVFSVGSFPTSGADLRVPGQALEDIWHRNRELIHVVRTPGTPPHPARGPRCRPDG